MKLETIGGCTRYTGLDAEMLLIQLQNPIFTEKEDQDRYREPQDKNEEVVNEFMSKLRGKDRLGAFDYL